MNEDDILNEIFGGGKWRDKYLVTWCDLCETAVITCGRRGSSSCNGGGCDTCHDDFAAFHKLSLHVADYLTPEESAVYQKGLVVRKFIKETLNNNDDKIDWKKLDEAGKLSDNNRAMFLNGPIRQEQSELPQEQLDGVATTSRTTNF